MMHWMDWGYRGFTGWPALIGPIFMAILWVLIIIGMVFFIRYMARAGRMPRGHEEDSLEILKRRYARGEIEKEEFEQKRNDLK
jgi:putative membrane protein